MLQIVQVETKNQNGENLVAKDNRSYKIVRVQEEPEVRNGRKVIPTSGVRTKVVFEKDPQGRVNPLYHNVEEGALMEGTIESVRTEAYFIPSRYGNDENEQGETGNWVSSYTAVVLNGENIYQLASSNGLDVVDEDGNPLDNRGNPLPSAKEVASNDSKISTSSESDDNPF